MYGDAGDRIPPTLASSKSLARAILLTWSVKKHLRLCGHACCYWHEHDIMQLASEPSKLSFALYPYSWLVAKRLVMESISIKNVQQQCKSTSNTVLRTHADKA